MKLTALTLSLILLSSAANAQFTDDFKQMDANGNGYIEKTELSTYIKTNMGEQTKGVFTSVDSDHNGSISEEEFMTFYTNTQNDKAGVGKLEQKFKDMDTNGDNQLSEEEVTSSNVGNADTNTNELFMLLDTDADNKVSQKEFNTFFNMAGQILGGN